MNDIDMNDTNKSTAKASLSGPSGGSSAARILCAVEDQHQRLWYRYGTPARSTWFSFAELQLSEKELLTRLSGRDGRLIGKTRRTLLEAVERHADFGKALVADAPG